ncbi:MAG: SUMF1/EgtB/PvdO family nonheme iron enzyme, partial [Spirosomataceae bacterium]
MNRVYLGLSAAVLSLAVTMTSCKNKTRSSTNPGRVSSATGIEYAKKETEGFHVAEFKGMPTGPNLVFIEGGRFTMGTAEEDVTFARDNLERTVTVASFFMDETEIANINWLEYLYAVQQDSSQEFAQSALPDTTVWANPMSFNDQYVDQYLRYPGFRLYPVVGVSWIQASDYCKWRSGTVNNQLYQNSLGKTKKGGISFGRKKDAEDGAEEPPKTMDGNRVAIESGIVLP